MKDTEGEVKYCQLQIKLEDYLGRDSAEHEEQLGAYANQTISETKDTKGLVVKVRLLETILAKRNIEVAITRIVRNRGSHGVDEMGVAEVRDYFHDNWSILEKKLLDGKYKPKPVRRVEIPKDNGSKRNLGIPTVIDRVIQQAIAQVLIPIYEPEFSDYSYGFRPNRSAKDAIEQVTKYANEGYRYVIDMDLEKYFDTVNQSKLIEILSRKIKDGRVISLIHKYLNAGVIVSNKFEETRVGVMQGSPLSPVLSNIMLNEFDKEMELRGNRCVRYADDVVLFFKSKRSAERVMESVSNYLEKKLFLKVNKEKTMVAYITKIKFLGFGFYIAKGGNVQITVHWKTKQKIRKKIKELTNRSYSISNEERARRLKLSIRGWVNYFKIADMKGFIKSMDEWMRRRIRMIYWKQWKKVKTRLNNLIKLGIKKNKAWEWANTRKGYWRTSKSPILSRTLTNDYLHKVGFVFFSDYY